MRILHQLFNLIMPFLVFSTIYMGPVEPAEEIPEMPNVEVPSTNAAKDLARKVIGKVNDTMYRLRVPGIIAEYSAELNKAAGVTEATLQIP